MLKNDPKISVIIPVYNSEKYIAQCLDSVIKQSFKNFELIVVDDCSTDKSVSIIKKFSNKFKGKLNLIELEKHFGNPGEPRNIGVENAKGKYIYFFDSDDILRPSALEELFFYTSDEEIDLIHSEKSYVPIIKNSAGKYEDTEIINDKTEFRNLASMTYDKPTFETNSIEKRIHIFCQKKIWSAVWRNLIKRDLIVENNLKFIDTKIYEDDLFTFQCFVCAKKILHIPNNFYIYRMRKNSVSHDSAVNKFAERISIITKIYKALNEFMEDKTIFEKKPNLKYEIFDSFSQKIINSKITMTELKEILIDCDENLEFTMYLFDMMNYYRREFHKSQAELQKMIIQSQRTSWGWNN